MKSLRGERKASTEGDAHLEKLVRRVEAGDALAFRLLYDLTRTALFYCALKVVRKRETAEDVLQEAFLAIWKLAPDFVAERGSAMTWMMLITRSRAIDSVRRQITNRENLTVAFEEGDEEIIQGPQTDPGFALDAKRLHEAACRHVGQLEASQRQAFELAFLSDMTHNEVALHTGMPLGTVKTRIRSVLSKLRIVMIAKPHPSAPIDFVDRMACAPQIDGVPVSDIT